MPARRPVATEEILRHANPPTIVVLTTFDQNEYVDRALRAGAAGFLLKDAPATRLIAAVRAAATGDSLIDPARPDSSPAATAADACGTHVSRAMVNLGARDRAQLVVFAY